MATTFSAIRDAVLSWAQDISGIQTVLANTAGGQAPQLASPYIEVFVESYDVPPNQVSKLSATEDIETVDALTFITILLDIFGGNAMQTASLLSRSLFSAQRYLDLWQISGFSGVEEIRDLTFLQTGAMKARAQMRFSIYARLSDDFVGQDIENIEIEVTIGGRDPINFEAKKSDAQNC